MHRSDFEQLYKDNLERVYRFIYYRVGGKVEKAEDLTSEVFMKALEHREKINKERYPVAYLMTIARNKLKNHYRDRKVETDVDDLAHVLQGEDGRRVLEKISDGHVLMEALETLSKESRQILELKHLEGFSFKEIAVIVGKKPGAVRVQAHRAMQELKSRYD